MARVLLLRARTILNVLCFGFSLLLHFVSNVFFANGAKNKKVKE